LKEVRDRAREGIQAVKLWKAWQQMDFPFGILFRFLLITAQRRGEVAAMEASSVSEKERLWTLASTKAGHGHEVPLSTQALDVLSKDQKEGEAALLHNRQDHRVGVLKGRSSGTPTFKRSGLSTSRSTPNGGD
jgi:integrase